MIRMEGHITQLTETNEPGGYVNGHEELNEEAEKEVEAEAETGSMGNFSV